MNELMLKAFTLHCSLSVAEKHNRRDTSVPHSKAISYLEI